MYISSLKNVPWVTVIMVNYNAGVFLQAAVDALARQTNQRYKLILVDNASEDGSIESLNTKDLTDFELLRLPENIGFAAANNLAARAANTPWIALLNPDTEADPNWLEALHTATHTYKDTRMFAATAIDMTNRDKLDGTGDCYFVMGIAWRGGYGRPSSELPAPGECFSPCGAAALFERRTFLDLGGFDERFFCYYEDVDLGFRMRLEGHRCIFLPEAVIYHFGSGVSGSGSEFVVRHSTRNRLWTFVKNMPPLALILGLPFHLSFLAILLIRGILASRSGPIRSGIIEGFAGIGPVLKDRKHVQSRRKLSSWQILASMSWSFRKMRNHISDVRPLNVKRPVQAQPIS